MGEPGPAIPPSYPGGSLAGIPASISVEVVDGSAQDGVHAMGQPGAVMQLRAVIRDAYGNIVGNNPSYPCTPQFWLEDATAPSGQPRATINNSVGASATNLVFGQGLGVFTVAVRCLEHPEINSLRNTAPFNFETSNSAFARAPQAKPGPNAGQRVLLGLGAAAVGVLLGLLIVDEIGTSGGGSCSNANPCVCSYGGANCTNKGTSFCTTEYGLGTCVSEDPNCSCDSNGKVSRVSSVEGLVRQGLRNGFMTRAMAAASRFQLMVSACGCLRPRVYLVPRKVTRQFHA